MNYVEITLFLIVSFLLYSVEIIENKKIKLLEVLLIVVFVLLAINRDMSVPDTSEYVSYYQQLGLNFESIYSSYFELGFSVLALFLKKLFGGNYKIFFLVITLINIFFIRLSIKQYKVKMLVVPLMLYISFYGFYFNFIVLRMGLAFSFLFYSWSIYKKKKLRALIFFVMAVLFHKSAIIGLIGYLVIKLKKRLTLQSYFMWLLIIMVLYIFKFDVTIYDSILLLSKKIKFIEGNRLIYYLQYMEYAKGISIRFIFNYILAILFISTGRKQDEQYFDLLNLYMVGLSFIALFPSFVWIERLSDFYLAGGFIMITLMIDKYKDKALKVVSLVPIIYLNFIFILRIINR